jgi:hypothetical protein
MDNNPAASSPSVLDALNVFILLLIIFAFRRAWRFAARLALRQGCGIDGRVDQWDAHHYAGVGICLLQDGCRVPGTDV